MAFPDGKAALAAIRSLNQGDRRRSASPAARNVLANLLATLAPRVAACAKPEQVLNRLEQLASATGSATLFYRSLLEHEALRDVVILMLDSGDLPVTAADSLPGAARFAAGAVRGSRHARAEAGVGARLARRARSRRADGPGAPLEEARGIQDGAGGSRQLGATLDTLQEKLSLLAELCVERAARWHAPQTVEREAWAVMALGKLGGIELAVHSDLDLVVFYDGDPEDARTFEQYQAFVEAMQQFLDQPTAEGIVYHVDTRLRPEGRKGALAIPVSMFQRYLETRAEIWERLAWTRCRPLAAPAALADRIQELVGDFVYGPWNPAIPGYMRDVRARMEREIAHESDRRLHFKAGKGGLADIDFALQMIQIREGRERLEFRVAGTRRLLSALPQTQYLAPAEADQLRAAHIFLRSLEMIARMDKDANVNWIPADAAELAPLGVRMGFPKPAGECLLDRYRQTTSGVRTIYLKVLEGLSKPQRPQSYFKRKEKKTSNFLLKKFFKAFPLARLLRL